MLRVVRESTDRAIRLSFAVQYSDVDLLTEISKHAEVINTLHIMTVIRQRENRHVLTA